MSPRFRIGKILKEQRVLQGLTGVQCGLSVGLSQSRIAKIEGGYLPFKRNEVESILNILKVSETIRQEIIFLCDQEDDRAPKKSLISYGKPRQQPLFLETKSTQVKTFCIGGIPALMQTPEYHAAVRTRQSFNNVEVAAALADLTSRQDNVWKAQDHYLFVITEAALYSKNTSTSDHLVQLDRLDRLLTTRMRIGIVPMRSGLPNVTLTNFVIYDDTLVKAESLSGVIDVDSPTQAQQYSKLFDELDTMALHGVEASTLVRAAIDYYGSVQA